MKPRHIPLFFARPYLAAWKADYPLDPQGDAYVFISEKEMKPFRYRALDKRIKLIAKRAGITKRVSGHLFRHSRITDLMKHHVREYTIREVGWGSQTTKMLSTYTHLVNNDVDEELSLLNGIEPDHCPEENILNPRQCPRCAVINSPTARFCMSCGVPLTQEAKITVDELTTEIEEHPIYKSIMKKIEEMILVQPKIDTK